MPSPRSSGARGSSSRAPARPSAGIHPGMIILGGVIVLVAAFVAIGGGGGGGGGAQPPVQEPKQEQAAPRQEPSAAAQPKAVDAAGTGKPRKVLKKPLKPAPKIDESVYTKT